MMKANSKQSTQPAPKSNDVNVNDMTGPFSCSNRLHEAYMAEPAATREASYPGLLLRIEREARQRQTNEGRDEGYHYQWKGPTNVAGIGPATPEEIAELRKSLGLPVIT